VSEKEKQLIKAGRLRARTDVLWLARHFYGWDKITDTVHGPMSRFLQQFTDYQGKDEWNETLNRFEYIPIDTDPVNVIKKNDIHGEKRLLLAPRGWYKTSLNVVAHTTQWILNFPDITTLWLHASQEVLEPALPLIKNIFWKNNVMRYYFPEYCAPMAAKEFGTQTSFNIPNRKKWTASPTVAIGGIESVRTGMHYHVIKYTDIVDEKNTATRDLCTKIVQKFAMCRNLLISAKYWSDVEGTRYNFSDLYGQIIDDWLKEEQLKQEHRYKVFCMGCYKKDLKGEEEHFTPDELDAPYLLDTSKTVDNRGRDLRRVSNFPENESTEILEDKRCDPSYGEDQFNTQQLNNPVGTDSMIFPPEQMKWKTVDEMKKIPFLYYTTTVDLAETTKKRSDFTAITTCGVDRMNRRYVMDIRLGRFLPDEIVDNLFVVQLIWKPIKIKVEETGFARGLKPTIARKSQMTGIYPNFVFLPRDTQDAKEERIKSIQPYYKSGLIYFSEGLDEFVKEHLKHELTRFPKYQHDDILDTLADQFQGETVYGPLKESPSERQILQKAQEIMIKRATEYQEIYGKNELNSGCWTGLGAL
jgi:predicted phage terminase large subunit-like protein